MVAKKEDIYIEQGATFDRTWQWREFDGESFLDPIDLTGYTARMQIREKVKDATVLLNASTEAGTIILGGTDGMVQILLPDELTATLAVASGVYDLELESAGGYVYRFLEGKVKVAPNVTRPAPVTSGG